MTKIFINLCRVSRKSPKWIKARPKLGAFFRCCVNIFGDLFLLSKIEIRKLKKLEKNKISIFGKIKRSQ